MRVVSVSWKSATRSTFGEVSAAVAAITVEPPTQAMSAAAATVVFQTDRISALSRKFLLVPVVVGRRLAARESYYCHITASANRINISYIAWSCRGVGAVAQASPPFCRKEFPYG